MSKAWGQLFGERIRQGFLILARERAWRTPGDIAEVCGVSVPTVYAWMREARERWSVTWAPEGVHVRSSPIIDIEALAAWHRSGYAWAGVTGPGRWVGVVGYVWPPLRDGSETPVHPDDELPEGRLHPDARSGVAAARIAEGIRRTQDRVMARMTDGARPVGFVPSGSVVTPRVTANDARENARIVGVDAPDVTD